MNSESLNIVIIDDQESDIFLLKKKLQKHFDNATFVTAENLDGFKEKIQWTDPDIVLSDYNLLGCTGLDVLLFTREHYPSVPFLFVTGMLNDEEKTAEVILNGANGYILKKNLDLVPSKVEEALTLHTKSKSAEENKRLALDRIELNLDKVQSLVKSQSSKEDILKIIEQIKQDALFLK